MLKTEIHGENLTRIDGTAARPRKKCPEWIRDVASHEKSLMDCMLKAEALL